MGIGNTLLTDEGVGVHVIEYLKERFGDRSEISFVDGGTLSFTLATELAAHNQLIVVDAASTKGPPGHVVCYEGEEMDRYLTGNRRSVHEVGLTDLLDIARLSDHYPDNRALVGIEPAHMGWGEQVSPELEPSVPIAAEKVMDLLDRWSVDSSG